MSPTLLSAEELNSPKAKSATAQARLQVEHAWETYHHAALGGTLASPSIQTELETNLHEARFLLSQAYDAEEQGDYDRARKLIDKITDISQKIITESQEPKK
ncbi:MAG: hypothetical protein G3M78_09990 [Candidatus Nitrohelix vancouverensis]|uniref:Uncharacterized protein n=1 Tax=Candidatus Nitrohelix vancouverensis TaxID=2705534 RepID=A0A7T0C363_9BACT|nr:MAG: hypothetical protein G3M78_09990 [Candidatus Nitrohelix vancouverensis]